MLNLNLKLQSSATKAQAKTIDLELRKLEATQAMEHLAIVQVRSPPPKASPALRSRARPKLDCSSFFDVFRSRTDLPPSSLLRERRRLHQLLALLRSTGLQDFAYEQHHRSDKLAPGEFVRCCFGYAGWSLRGSWTRPSSSLPSSFVHSLTAVLLLLVFCFDSFRCEANSPTSPCSTDASPPSSNVAPSKPTSKPEESTTSSLESRSGSTGTSSSSGMTSSRSLIATRICTSEFFPPFFSFKVESCRLFPPRSLGR